MDEQDSSPPTPNSVPYSKLLALCGGKERGMLLINHLRTLGCIRVEYNGQLWLAPWEDREKALVGKRKARSVRDAGLATAVADLIEDSGRG